MKRKHPRNNSIFDGWSIVHLATGVVFGFFFNPLFALLVMVLWEPFEIFVLSPLLFKIDIEFGYETWRNSLSDIVFDALGVTLGFILVNTFTFHL